MGRWRYTGFFILLTCCSFCFGIEGRIGDKYNSLKIDGQVYQKVTVKQITPQGLILFHKEGISQVPFRDLSTELQRKYGYDAEKEAAYLEEREQREAEAEAAEEQETEVPRKNEPQSVLDRFGTPPTIHRSLDMRPAFSSMNLQIKNQGHRPSCAVFAVVSALEFENAKTTKQPEKLSEEYLIWATRETLGIPGTTDPDYDPELDGDLGFTLTEVIQAVRRYGVPLASDMPNTYGKSMAKIRKPRPSVIENARQRRKLTASYITGRTNQDKIANIVHALNAVDPVVIGIRWPHEATLRNAPLLSKQAPQYNHAVTLVGYKCETGKIEDMLFMFKNSWGPDWGINGHGWITYEYLKKNLQGAAILEVGRS